MKTFTKILLTLMFAVTAFGSAQAQDISALKTVDPVGDSLAIMKMRQRMDKIRRQRPTVALVLSGGGAKGAAHIGAIDFLEKVGIPVDMVLGTSMGGLIGGLYSLGYSPKQMDSLLRSLDWNLIMSDKIPNTHWSYNQKKYREQYLFSIPFYNSANTIFSSDKPKKRDLKEEMHLPDVLLEQENTDPGHLHLGANDEFTDKSLKDNLFGSLPAGYIFGHNVNNLISCMSVGYQDDMDFSDLPIPFFCIAGDMVTGKAKLWHDGKLANALRSTMSIPGVFAPVRTDGMVLVDGGVRNNFPTDVAKAMGADIIIGVELSDADMTYADINNIGDIVWKFIDILGMDAFNQNVTIPDVIIKPELTGYNMMSFDPESISIIIQRGYRAAFDKSDDLFALKDKIGRSDLTLQNKPAIDLGIEPIEIASIQFDGLSPSEVRYLSSKFDLKKGDIVTKNDIEEAVAELYATKSFSSVSYELLGTEQPFILNLKCEKGPVHQVGFGTRFDTETQLSALVNVGFNVHRIEGSSWDFTGKVSSNPYADIHYVYKIPNFPTINLDAKFSYNDAFLYQAGFVTEELTYSSMQQSFYLSDWSWKQYDVKAGIRNDLTNIIDYLTQSNMITGDSFVGGRRNDYVSAFLDSRRYSFDDGYFPTKGSNIGISYRYVFAGLIEDIKPFHTIQADLSTVWNLNRFIDIIPTLNTRFVIGDEFPVPYMNLAGGCIPGRYIEQQMPFIGVNYATSLKSKMILGRMDLRVRPTKNNYISAIINVIKDSDDFDLNLLYKGPTTFGAGLEYAYDSILGPIKLNVHWSNLTNKFQAYFSFGYDF